MQNSTKTLQALLWGHVTPWRSPAQASTSGWQSASKLSSKNARFTIFFIILLFLKPVNLFSLMNRVPHYFKKSPLYAECTVRGRPISTYGQIYVISYIWQATCISQKHEREEGKNWETEVTHSENAADVSAFYLLTCSAFLPLLGCFLKYKAFWLHGDKRLYQFTLHSALNRVVSEETIREIIQFTLKVVLF